MWKNRSRHKLSGNLNRHDGRFPLWFKIKLFLIKFSKSLHLSATLIALQQTKQRSPARRPIVTHYSTIRSALRNIPEEFSNSGLHLSAEFDQRLHGEIDFSAFDPTYVPWLKMTDLSEFFLGPSPSLSQPANPFTQSFLNYQSLRLKNRTLSELRLHGLVSRTSHMRALLRAWGTD